VRRCFCTALRNVFWMVATLCSTRLATPLADGAPLRRFGAVGMGADGIATA
jgi:hypothetical protein